MCKFPIFLPFIICSVSHYVQVLHLFTFHYIFSVPFWASSLSISIPLDLQCPILGKFPIYLHFIISLVSHLGQVPYLFTFHQMFSVSLCASSPSFYIPLYLQCPILGKYPIALRFIISSVSHYVPVLHIFTFYFVFSVQLCASSLLLLHFIIFLMVSLLASTLSLRLIISFACHYVQVPYLFTFHYIFSVPFWASSLSIYISLDLQCPIMCKFSIFFHFIISLVSHLGQVPYLFTFHYIFSVPFGASSLSFYLSLYLQFPILMCQFPPFDTFHYIFSVPFWASTLQFYVSLYLQCPIMSKYPIILCFIIYLVSHYVQVLHLFTFHYIFSVPFWASTLQLYVSLFLQCPILGKYPIILCFIIYLVSHYMQVPYHFMFHYIFSVPLCASSLLLLHFIIFLMVSLLASTLSLRLIISFACHYVQVHYLFTFHYIFSVPLCACSISFYLSLYLQCLIMCKFPTFVTFHYIFNGLNTSKYPIITFNYIFRMSLYASSLSIYISLYLQCPILGKFPIYLHSIRSSVSHFGQVPYLFTFHYIFSVPFWASSLSIYIPLDLQCPIICMFPIFLPFIISLVSHSGQVPHSFTFHYFFSVPLCACSLSFYISLYIQCPIVCEYPIILCFIICSVSHYVQVLHLFTIHYIFSVPFWASTLQLYVSLFLQCSIMCMFPIFLHFIIYLVSHYVQVPYHFMFHYIFSVPLCAIPYFCYISLYF